MNAVATALLAATPWADLPAAPGTAADVPAALTALAASTTDEEATKHYWRVDNVVVVQGNLHESAVPVVHVVFALLATPLPTPAHFRLVELLVEIAGGDTSPEATTRGADVATEVRTALREGLWSIYALLTAPDPRTRAQALTLLGWLEDSPTVLTPILDHLATTDPAPEIRTAAIDLRAEYP